MQGAQVRSLVKELDPTFMPQLRVHMPQLRVHMPQLRSLRAATKTQCNQINKFKKRGKKEILSLCFAYSAFSPLLCDIYGALYTQSSDFTFSNFFLNITSYFCLKLKQPKPLQFSYLKISTLKSIQILSCVLCGFIIST